MPTSSPYSQRDSEFPLIQVAGKAEYQNRKGAITIEIKAINVERTRIWDETVTDSRGNYTLSVPSHQSFWLIATAPMHRPFELLLIAETGLPPITLSGGDLNADGCVNDADLNLLRAHFDQREQLASDITGDGVTDASDLAILAGNYQEACTYVAAAIPDSSPTPVDDTATPDVPTAIPTAVPDLPESVIWAEPFDSAEGWLAEGTWTYAALAQHGGGWLSISTIRMQTNTLTSAYEIDLSGVGYPELTYWQRADLSSGDVVTVDVSTDGGTTWQMVDEQIAANTDWVARTVNLSLYQGQRIRLRFTLDTNGIVPVDEVTTDYWLDDLSIALVTGEAPTDTPPTLAPEVVLLPVVEAFDKADKWLAEGTWTHTATNAHSGGGWLAISKVRMQTNTLTSAYEIDLSGAGYPELTYWQRADLSSGDVVTVDVSTDGGTTWQTVDEQIALNTDWAARTVNLSLYQGQRLRLRFALDTNGAVPVDEKTTEYGIDDVMIVLVVNPPTATPTPVPTETAVPTSIPTDPPQDTPVPTPTVPPTLTATPAPVIVPFVDSFNHTADWLMVGAWMFDQQTAYQGTGWFADGSQRGTLSTLTHLKRIDLSQTHYPEMRFWHKASLAPTDTVTVDVSLDGVIWQPVWQQSGLITDWTPVTVDLSAYQGTVITLRFRLDALKLLPDGVTSTGYWLDELWVYDMPAPTPTAPPTIPPLPTSTPAAILTATMLPKVTPIPTAMPTAIFTPTFTATMPPKVTPAPLSTLLLTDQPAPSDRNPGR